MRGGDNYWFDQSYLPLAGHDHWDVVTGPEKFAYVPLNKNVHLCKSWFDVDVGRHSWLIRRCGDCCSVDMLLWKKSAASTEETIKVQWFMVSAFIGNETVGALKAMQIRCIDSRVLIRVWLYTMQLNCTRQPIDVLMFSFLMCASHSNRSHTVTVSCTRFAIWLRPRGKSWVIRLTLLGISGSDFRQCS